MKLFGGKKRQYSATSSPAERVIALSSQGLSEPEIIQVLREEGYTPVQVDGAMREALRGVAVGTGPGMRPSPPAAQRYAPSPQYQQAGYGPPGGGPARPRPYPEYSSGAAVYTQREAYPQRQESMPEPPFDFEEFKKSNRDLGFPEVSEAPERGPLREQPFAREPPREMPEILPDDDFPEDEEEEVRPLPAIRRERGRGEIREDRRRALEELTEGVVEEKWTDFRRKVEDINGRFHQINDRIDALEHRLGQMQGDKKGDVLEIGEKIDSYKQSLDEIDSRMEAVEKAIKDSLTPMMQTLRSLADAVKALKGQ